MHTDEVLERLDEQLVGLAPVKSRISEIGDRLLVDRLRRRFGIDARSVRNALERARLRQAPGSSPTPARSCARPT